MGSEGSGEGEGLSSLRAFAHSSSLHGISHVFAYGAVSLRRVLWGAFFLGSLGLLLLVCAERVAYFLTYPHVTKLDEVAAHNLTFPAITICNLNEFRFSKITRNDMYHVGELLALLNDRYEISNPQLAEPHVLAALRDKANFKNFKAKPFSMAEFYNRTGHDLADMLLQCSFRGANCTARNFTVVSAGLGVRAGARVEERVPPGMGWLRAPRDRRRPRATPPGSGSGMLRHPGASPFSRPAASHWHVPPPAASQPTPAIPGAAAGWVPAWVPPPCARRGGARRLGTAPRLEPCCAGGPAPGWAALPAHSHSGAGCRRVRGASRYGPRPRSLCAGPRCHPAAAAAAASPGCVCTQAPTPAAPPHSRAGTGWGTLCRSPPLWAPSPGAAPAPPAAPGASASPGHRRYPVLPPHQPCPGGRPGPELRPPGCALTPG